MIWHYTTRYNLIDILRSRHIRTSPIEPLPGERAAVWFSSAPEWEPTAAKGVFAVSKVTNGPMGEPALTSRDQLEALMGLARIGVDERTPNRYTSFNEFSQCCDPDFIEHLILRAQRMRRTINWDGPTGPAYWTCSLTPVLVHEFARVELWNAATQAWDIGYMRSTRLDSQLD